MITQGTIDKFYRDVEALGLKYPVAEISKKTGLSKGQVSQVLNKKLSPSEQLINKFNESFNIVQNGNASGSQNAEKYLDASGVRITLQDYINLLHRENDRLFTLLNSTLGQIKEDSRYALAYQKAWVKYEAEKVAKGDKKLENQLRYKMSKLVDDEIHGDYESDNPGETHKQHKA